MATEKIPSETPTAAPEAAMSSCRKKTSENASFIQDVRDHIDEFIHAYMDEHKTCFQKTIKKMFEMSQAVAERSAAEAKEIESVLPLQTTVADSGSVVISCLSANNSESSTWLLDS